MLLYTLGCEFLNFGILIYSLPKLGLQFDVMSQLPTGKVGR